MIKVEFNEMVFDEFSVELTNQEVIDFSKSNKVVSLDSIKYAWGYVCKECAEKHNFKLDRFNESADGMVCYVDGCHSVKDVYDISLTPSEIMELKFIVVE